MIPTLEDFSNPTWWRTNTKYDVKTVIMDDIDGGYSATMSRITITLDNDEEKKIILKKILPGSVSLSVNSPFGVARESNVVQEFSAKLSPNVYIPHCFYGYGDMETDVKYLLIEDLTSLGYIQAGYFFNPNSPFNGGKDLPSLTASFEGITNQVAISKAAFESIAYLHATYWVSPNSALFNDKNQNQKTDLPSYLRGATWPTGKGKEQWLTYQNFAKSHWESRGPRELQWDPALLEIFDASLAKVDWDVYVRSLREKPYTIIHGDFHPANCLIAKGNPHPEDVKVAFIDWEMCGIGYGPQDIAHFLLSSMAISERKVVEKDLLLAYHNALVKHGVKDYSFEDAWNDYVIGGIGKWIWIVAVATGMSIVPDSMVQYFRDQLADFIYTHGITAETVPMAIV